jgi:hypothetical protein
MENIHFFIEDYPEQDVDVTIDKSILSNSFTENEMLNLEFSVDDLTRNVENKNNVITQIDPYHFVNYSNNTIKELLLICDYYGITKELKLNKCTKTQIINILTDFELLSSNKDIVFKRKNMWFYINELKNDKFMKKYILC